MLQVLGALVAADVESSARGPQYGGWGTEDGDSDGSDTEDDEEEDAALEHAENAAVLKAAGCVAGVGLGPLALLQGFVCAAAGSSRLQNRDKMPPLVARSH